MPDNHDTPVAVRDLARQLSEPKPMRRGTLSVQYLRCNKPGCGCADRPGARHGPYYRVVRVVEGKTRSRHVPSAQADLLRQQVEAGQQFRRHVEAYWQACEQWADAQLEAPEAASQEAAKKGGSKRRSKPRSSPRSKRS
ncbi:MAG: DUF6788 family protein [Pseudomonadota bacterium]